jgi:ATP-dependent protease Clp ATPase subunit
MSGIFTEGQIDRRCGVKDHGRVQGRATGSKLFNLIWKSAAEFKGVHDEYNIGHEIAKNTLSVAVHNHYKRLSSEGMAEIHHESAVPEDLCDAEVEKSNIMLVDPTGCDKTLLPRHFRCSNPDGGWQHR